MKKKFNLMWRGTLAMMMVLMLGLVTAAPASATHTSSSTIDFASSASTVTGESSTLDVTVTNGGASAGDITTVKIDFTASDFTLTGEGTEPGTWSGTVSGSVVTYTHATGIAPGDSVIFVPVVDNPATAGPAAVPAVTTTDAGSKAALAAASNTGWIGYVADAAGAGGNDITVEYVDPGQVSRPISVNVVVKAITVSLETDAGGAVVSTAAEVKTEIDTLTAATDLIDATADSGHLTFVVQPLTVPAFTGGTSPEADKVSPVTPATLAITGVLPEITAVAPDAGNVGDTMWVEVTGTDFTGTIATNASTTSLNFGTGITVAATKFISATEIDAQITITASGAVRDVIATTAAGTGTVGSGFTPNAANTEQVDVWGAYTPTDDPFVTGTLTMTVAVQTSIGSAITAASASDILIAHAATYVEEVTISKSITLKSLSGKATTIIDASGSGETGITIQAADATVDGFTVDSIADGNGIFVGADGATIQNNTIDSAGTSILAGGGGIDGAHVLNNLISNTNQGIWMGVGATDWLIEGNTIGERLSQDPAGIVMPGGTSGTPTKDITIKGNAISDNISTGIYLRDEGGGTFFENITIEGNTISGASVYGIETDPGLTFADLVIIKNDISANWEDGIRIRSWAASAGNVIKYNNLYGNGLVGTFVGGIKNQTGTAVDARYNWWGAIGGPDASTSASWGPAAGIALGDGDRISKDVDYDPWLTTVQATAVTAGIAYHGSSFPLEAGWNTLSVPLALNDSADTLDDIVALGDFLVVSGASQNYDGGYYYDAANSLWLPLTGTYEFKPGEAVYVKMLVATEFPVLFSGTFSVPSVSLPAGWNLVGSAFGVDKAGTYPDGDYGIAAVGDVGNEDEKAVSVALASLGTSASVVISPSMPGQTVAWATVASDTSTDMIVGEGYWVFMTGAATLAGFEVTPIYKIFLP